MPCEPTSLRLNLDLCQDRGISHLGRTGFLLGQHIPAERWHDASDLPSVLKGGAAQLCMISIHQMNIGCSNICCGGAHFIGFPVGNPLRMSAAGCEDGFSKYSCYCDCLDAELSFEKNSPQGEKLFCINL